MAEQYVMRHLSDIKDGAQVYRNGNQMTLAFSIGELALLRNYWAHCQYQRAGRLVDSRMKVWVEKRFVKG